MVPLIISGHLSRCTQRFSCSGLTCSTCVLSVACPSQLISEECKRKFMLPNSCSQNSHAYIKKRRQRATCHPLIITKRTLIRFNFCGNCASALRLTLPLHPLVPYFSFYILQKDKFYFHLKSLPCFPCVF